MAFFERYIETLKLVLTPQIYDLSAAKLIFNAIAIISAIVILALFVATAVLSKKQRVIGIVAGVVNFINALLIPLFLRLWHSLKIGVYTFNSQAAANEFMIKNLLTSLGALAILGVITVASVLSIVYVATTFKNKPVIFAIGALVIVIIRQFWIAPFQTSIPMLYKLFVSNWQPTLIMYSQAIQLCAYFGSLILVLALALVPVIIKKIKEGKAPVAAQAVEETPATEEAPASEETAE